MVLFGRDVCNCMLCHLPNVDSIIDPSLAMIQTGLRCMLCGFRGGAAHMLVCDKCSKGLTHSQFLEGLKCESQIKNNGRVRSRGMLPGS